MRRDILFRAPSGQEMLQQAAPGNNQREEFTLGFGFIYLQTIELLYAGVIPRSRLFNRCFGLSRIERNVRGRLAHAEAAPCRLWSTT